MEKSIKLQAHRGVSAEYPENTMPAFIGAVDQGYEIIELDPNVTSDGKIVVLHDNTINRTARNTDGSKIEKVIKISDITYEEALRYDFGAFFSDKFKGTPIPLLSEVLDLAEKNNITVKLDNKIAKFNKENIASLFHILKNTKASLAFTCGNLDFAKVITGNFPQSGLHYDGEVNEEILQTLNNMTEPGKLTVWLPYRCALTSWVKIAFASEELCSLVKRYASLGIWLIDDYEHFKFAKDIYRADIVETSGKIKPVNIVNNFTDKTDGLYTI